jgi:predicted kinase
MNKYKKIPQLLLLVGPPGSGKSTFAQQYLQEHPHWVRVCRDDLRAMQYQDTRATNMVEVNVSKMVHALTQSTLLQGKNVLIDSTNCKLSTINEFVKHYKHTAHISFKVFDVDIDTLKQRCALREKAIGKVIGNEVIDKIVRDFEILKTNFNFETIKCEPLHFVPKQQLATLPSCILCDLDGTVALPNGRSMFSPSDDEILQDSPVPQVINILQAMAQQHTIIFVSGRNQNSRAATEQWLATHLHLPYTPQLYMRAMDDMRRDSIVKQEILHLHILPQYNVLAVFDDRLQVIRECWNKEGIFCFNVNQLMEEF